jgi:hypothetical protein
LEKPGAIRERARSFLASDATIDGGKWASVKTESLLCPKFVLSSFFVEFVSPVSPMGTQGTAEHPFEAQLSVNKPQSAAETSKLTMQQDSHRMRSAGFS